MDDEWLMKIGEFGRLGVELSRDNGLDLSGNAPSKLELPFPFREV